MGELPRFPERENRILSFEDFSFRAPENYFIPKYNNFYIYFTEGFFGDTYREREHYLRFASEYPEMASSLREKIQAAMDSCATGSISRSEALRPLDHDLYLAYKTMKQSGVLDSKLFV